MHYFGNFQRFSRSVLIITLTECSAIATSGSRSRSGGASQHTFSPAAYRPMAYIYTMNFEWDESKSEGCFTQRGFDFAYSARAFFDPTGL